MRKWLSNSKRVQEIVEPKHAALHDERNLNDDESFAKASLGVRNDTQLEKILGIDWNCVSDEFLIQFTTLTESAKSLVPTKRNILSILAGLYDPLGFVSPLVVTIKVLFQELWIEGFAWDDELDENRKRRWLGWIEELERIGKVAVPRCFYGLFFGNVRCSLHGFADASVKAYCAVVYFVSELCGAYNIELLTSKTRVAPNKSHTIPRLELMSGRILAQLMSSVKHALGSEVEIIETYFWLDSKTALCWIYNRGEWNKFVRHRVNEILNLSRKEDWNHCPGEDNPADVGSRGTVASKLKDNTLWWKGPSWLAGPKDGWPMKNEIEATGESQSEAKQTVVLAANVEKVPSLENVLDIRRFGSLCKLVRVASFVVRFVNNLKARVIQVDIMKYRRNSGRYYETTRDICS